MSRENKIIMFYDLSPEKIRDVYIKTGEELRPHQSYMFEISRPEDREYFKTIQDQVEARDPNEYSWNWSFTNGNVWGTIKKFEIRYRFKSKMPEVYAVNAYFDEIVNSEKQARKMIADMYAQYKEVREQEQREYFEWQNSRLTSNPILKIFRYLTNY